MKNLLYPILIICFYSCIPNDSRQKTYATNEEKTIIGNMSCWKSVTAERTMTSIAFQNDEKKKDKLWKDWGDAQKVVREKGQVSLYNDTTFIDLIRNDSLYNVLYAERKEISQHLSTYKNKIPFFEKYIDKIKNDIIEYNYYSYNTDWGIYEYSFKKDFIINSEPYKNYSDLLKEGYSLTKNSDVKEEDILNLNNILKSLENLDRKLWAVKYFKKSKEELEKKELEKERSKQVDSLFDQ